MSTFFLILGIFIFCAGGMYVGFLYFLYWKISQHESTLIEKFLKRNDILPAIFEASKNYMPKSEDIFREVLELRANEFGLRATTKSFEVFGELEKKIHHEINFIFQVCNKNHTLLKQRNFLYIRDVIISQSSLIAKDIQKTRKFIQIYNSFLSYKNWTLFGLFFKIQKKESL